MLSLVVPSQEVDYLEGGVLQDPNDRRPSSFNVLVVELEDKSQRIHRFSWSKKDARYQEDAQPMTLAFLRNAFRFRNTFVLSPAFEQVLADPGANYSHPAKSPVNLDDLFIYPDFRLVPKITDEPREPTLISEDIPGFVMKVHNLLILGAEKSGKSSVAKSLFLDLRKRGLIPLLLDGRNINKPDDNVLDKAITEAFASQYQSPDFVAYAQRPSETRVIIMDDMHLLPFSPRGRDRVLRYLQTRSAIVVLLGDDTARFDDVLGRAVNNRRSCPTRFVK